MGVMRRFYMGWSVALPALLQAQQTIVNLPSADQTPEGRLFFLHESQVRAWDPQPYWATTNFLVYGLTGSIELCLTQYQLGVPRQPYGAVAAGYKGTRQFLRRVAPQWELKLTGGQMFALSTTGKGFGVWSYAIGSFVLPYLHTRLAGGISLGPRVIFGTLDGTHWLGVSTVHFIGSVEQPVTKSLKLVAEWFSGQNHEFAYFVPGINYHVEDWIFVLAYKIANDEDSHYSNGLIIEVGYFFDL